MHMRSRNIIPSCFIEVPTPKKIHSSTVREWNSCSTLVQLNRLFNQWARNNWRWIKKNWRDIKQKLKSQGVNKIYRIIVDETVQVEAARLADRISLQPAAGGWVVNGKGGLSGEEGEQRDCKKCGLEFLDFHRCLMGLGAFLQWRG